MDHGNLFAKLCAKKFVPARKEVPSSPGFYPVTRTAVSFALARLPRLSRISNESLIDLPGNWPAISLWSSTEVHRSLTSLRTSNWILTGAPTLVWMYLCIKNNMNHTPEIIISLRHVTKTFSVASGTFDALKDVDLSIPRGFMVAITGKSGSGKSTLVNIIAGLDRPTRGAISVNGINVEKLSESALASWRGRNVGVVFQFFQLLPTLTILENVMLPMDFCKTYSRKERKERALTLLQKVKIEDQANKFPAALSGGQQQRAAIARALANDPPLIIADEPTGNLDSQNAKSIFDLFTDLAKMGKTVIIVTHEKDFSSNFHDVISIVDGVVMNGNQNTLSR